MDLQEFHDVPKLTTTGLMRLSTPWKSHAQTALLKVATIKPKLLTVHVMVCETSIILETGFFFVIHKNRAGADAPTQSYNYSILPLPHLLT